MNKKARITNPIQSKVVQIIDKFNKKHFKKEDAYYVPRFTSRYLFLDRYEYGRTSPVCRLTFNGEMDNWDFAIFKWSIDNYSDDTLMMPGEDEIDGTIEGAMKAGLALYPVRKNVNREFLSMFKDFWDEEE